MRWPFLFGRASAANGSQKAPAPTALREWASLPAIQRVLGEPQLTAASSEFVHSLAGTRDPDLSLEPLGHHVSLEAPSGLVSGIARHVETYAPSNELVGRPRPRGEAAVQRRFGTSDEAAVGPAAEGERELEPERVAMTFAAIDEPVPVHAPLTRMAEPEADTVLSLASRRPALDIPARPEHVSSNSPAPEDVRPVTAQRLSLGQSRRLGLGAPLPHRPTPAAVQRSLDPTPLDLGTPVRIAPERHVEARPEVEVEAANHHEERSSAPAVEPIAPIAGGMVQRRAAPEADEVAPPAGLPRAPAAAAAPAETRLAPGRAVIQRAVASPLPPLLPRPASAPTAPLVSGRPPLVTVRPPSGSEDVGSGESQPVLVQRLPAVTPSEPALAMPPAGIGPAAVPASASPEIAAFSARSIRALPPLAPAIATVQRVHPSAQDFVAYSPFATTPAPISAGSAVPVAPVQREMAEGESPSPVAPASAPVAAAASAGAAAAEAGGQSEKELDELARKLHDRISLHLRRDLLIQRERAGMVTDLR